jgi:hypothetical protein
MTTMGIDYYIMQITRDDLREHRNISPCIIKWSEHWRSAYLYGWKFCYIAVDDDDEVVGFQAVNSKKETVAIEIHPRYQHTHNIAFDLVKESGSIKPERNDNPSLWAFWAEVAIAFN